MVKSHGITLLLLLVAALLYVAGAALPATALFFIGALFEVAFWMRLFRGGRG